MKSKWWLKAIIQKLVSILPGNRRINYLFQRYVTTGLVLSDELFSDKLAHAKRHIKSYQGSHGGDVPVRVLELGTGWFPVVPLAFVLTGVSEVVTVDLHAHIRRVMWKSTLEKFIGFDASGKLEEMGLSTRKEMKETIRGLLKKSSGPVADMKLLGIISLAGDIQKIDPGENGFDMVCSNNVLEHIPPASLVEIFRFFRSLLRKGGIMSHFVDMSDHYSHFDPDISPWHFLKFSAQTWKLIDNSLQPQNRKRLPFYRSLFEDNGFRIISEQRRTGNRRLLEQETPDSSFAGIPLQEMLVTHAHFVAVTEED